MLTALALAALSTSAHAAADLRTTNTPAPATTAVYDAGRWYVQVSNIGNRSASSVTLSIQLPVTHTSPSVYVMGVVGAKSGTCTTSGTKINCSLGTINRGSSTTVYFDISLPESAAALTFTSTAATTSAETTLSNNVDTDNATLDYDEVVLPGIATDAFIDHCTGTSLTAYYECTLFPSSITSHEHTFETDGTISFPATYPATYAGTWSVVGDRLTFEYNNAGTPILSYTGRGVSASCWEGLTTFASSVYVAPYSVCF